MKLTHPPYFKVLFTLVVVMLFNQGALAETLIDRVIAVVNDRVILKSELNTKMFTKIQSLAAQNIAVHDTKSLQKKVLNMLILEILQIERAEKIGLEVTDEEIVEQLQVIAQRSKMTLMALRNQLNTEVPNGFQKIRQQIKIKLLIQKLREVEVISQAHVTESEIKNFLQREALENSNIKVQLSHILIEIPDSATPKERNQALSITNNIRQRLKTGEDFSQLAVRYSNGSKALEGGDLGWLNQGEVPTFFSSAVVDLVPGQISKVIQSPSGFHLIKLINKKNEGLQLTKEYHLHQFIILSNDALGNAAPAYISKLARKMNSLTDFKALSHLYPNIPAKINAKSDLGWRSIENISTSIRARVESLDINQALPVLASSKGWVILYLEDIRLVDHNYRNRTQQAIQSIRMRKANEMFDLWLRQMKDEAFIQISFASYLINKALI